MILTILQEQEFNPILRIIFLVVFFIGMTSVIFGRFYVFFEQRYAGKFKKPFFIHAYLIKRKLTDSQRSILRRKFPFYNSLNPKQKRHFEHRVASFIKDKQFIGRQELEVTQEMKVLISATATMLTFGFKDYLIDIISMVIIYPSDFFSVINKNYHKGEFNPQLKALVLSWKHFQEGFDVSNDNLNLGIHEFTHAIHLNSIKNNDVSSNIFSDAFDELMQVLSNNEEMRRALIDSKYFRTYAYSNQYEFVAVITEAFIETPHEFRMRFPEVYNKTKQMLNFNFKGY